MSRTYKDNPPFYHRKPSGRKHAIINNVRNKALPPSVWDDINIDKHGYQTKNIIINAFKNGVELEKIRKIKEQRKIPYWKWHAIIDMIFNNCITVIFKGHIGLSENKIVPLSTPYCDPFPIVQLKGTPLDTYGEFIIIANNKLLRYIQTETILLGIYGHIEKEIPRNKIYEFKNRKLTQILIHVKNLYYGHGMKIEEFIIRKWKLGLDKAKISGIFPADYSEG